MQIKSKKEEYYHFDRLSEEWWNEKGKFKVLHDIKPLRMEYIIDQLNGKKLRNLEILDIGCGGGLICEPLCRLGAQVTGIDYVKKNIDVAKIHAKDKKLKINYVCKDIEKLSLKKEYDLIIMFEILEHLDDWKKFLFKIKNNLKKNGKIIVSTINRNILSRYTAIYLAENIFNWIPKGTHDYNKFIKPDEIIEYISDKDLKCTSVKGMNFNPIDMSWNLSNFKKINYFCTLTKVN